METSVGITAAAETGQADVATRRGRTFQLSYLIDENPPWLMAFFLGFQHYLTMVGGTIGIPFILSVPLCFEGNAVVISQVLSTILFVSGIITLLQTTFGSRLPIVQGASFAFVVPTFAILSLDKWKCPKAQLSGPNITDPGNGDDDAWKSRMNEIQGAIIVASLCQILIGCMGLVGFFLRFIGPLTVAPTITLIGLGLVDVAATRAGNHWGIAIMTILLVTIFSQFMHNVKVPLPGYNKEKGRYVARYPVCRYFPIILAIVVSWIICIIITSAGGFPSDPRRPAFKARTDARSSVIKQADWFRVPYPGQWGAPTVSLEAVIGMLSGTLVSVVESVGDYYACARLSGAPPPPRHAINRGVAVEGLGGVIAGLTGTGSGTSSYSSNIAAIGITKVGSRRVIQCGGVLMIVFGVVPKFSALFTAIPDPILGGLFLVIFGLVTSVGLSNLQHVDLNSPRNLYILGFSLLLGLALPAYLGKNPGAIHTGSPAFDQIITVLLKTSMAVGAISAILLDNLVPGTPEERGLMAWGEQHGSLLPERMRPLHVYDLPFGLNRFNGYKLAKFVPFLPYYSDDADLEIAL